jgi:hypothetical protein
METTAETLELDENGSVNLNPESLENDDLELDANGTQPANGEGAPGEVEEEDEVHVQFGDEEAPTSTGQEHEDAPQWIKDLRKQNREQSRELRELKAREKLQQPQQPAVPTLGDKPKLDQFDYDEGKFDEALGAWYAKKAVVDAAQAEQRNAEEARKKANQDRLTGYQNEATSLRAKDFQDVESEVVQALTVEQQGILLAGADKPAALVYALGRYPNKLRELSQIKDPVRFAFAAAKLEKELKVTTTRTNKPAPEGRVSSASGAPSAGGGEKKLEQLRAEAEKTGDFTKVISYKAQLKAQTKKR